MAAKQGKVCTINRHLSKKSESGPILFTECNDEMETPVDKFASLTLDRELYKLDSARNVKVNYSVPIDSKSPWKMIKESPIRTMKVKLYLPPGQDHALNDNAQLFSNIVGVTETPRITGPDEFHELHCGDESFEFTVLNASASPTGLYEKKEETIYKEYMKIVCSERISKLPHQFLDPLQSDVVNQFVIFGQISEVRGFEEPNIFVQYQTFLPSGWKHEFDSKNISSKYSQTTCCELELKTNLFVGRLGVPIELSLCSGEPLGEFKPPKLYFKVWSIDSMDRQRIQGYGCLVLPTTAGIRNYTIQTWKPKQHFQSQLTSYFLGGSPDLIEFNFNELENVESNNHYGFQTQTSGSVSISLNCIFRSRLNMLTRREMIERQEEYVVESAVGASTKAALQRAKLRLKALKAFANNEDPTAEEP